MSWWGKLIGGAFGFLSAGPLGAVLGAALGHTFDKGMDGLKNFSSSGYGAGDQERVQAAFFSATFSVMGHVAKADGQVSPDEIQLAKLVMAQMELSPEKRKVAINLFNEGKKADFPLNEVLAQFKKECHGRRNLIRMFLEILLSAGYADGTLHPKEKALLQHIGVQLGFSSFEFQRIEAAVNAARTFYEHERAGSGATSHPHIKEDYAMLDVDPSASNDEIKRAYRRLMNQHHPDKLVSRGLPEEMIKIATEKTSDIRAAYDRLRKKRGF